MRKVTLSIVWMLIGVLGVSSAQEQSTGTSNRAVPGLMKFSGTARDSSSKPLNGVVGITFALYTNEEGGAALWMETQNVQADASGRYAVSLGANKPLPVELFSSGEARWLGVQIAGQREQNRILLLSVPYALKAADAETLGGFPPSAFALAAPASSLTSTTSAASQGATAQPATGTTPVTTAGGTVNKLAKFDAAADIANSLIFDNGTSVGIGNTAPAATLDVTGAGIFRGALSLPATGTAIATAGKNSQPFNFTASSFSSSTLKAVNETFRWQAEPVGNNTTTPSGTLNLLFGSGTAAPTETGLKLSSKGLFTFATGQTFPGTGKGTVTSVALAAPASDFKVSGSPITGAGTLNLAWTVAPTGANTANSIVKRDATGSFNANIITASGAILGNSGISSQTSAAGGVAIDGFATGTGTTTGVLGSTTSSGAGSTGVVGLDQNTSGTANTNGVKGVTLNPVGIGVLGTGSALSNTFNSLSPSPTGVWGDSPSGQGVQGTTDSGAAVVGFAGAGGTGIEGIASGNTAAIIGDGVGDAQALFGINDATGPPTDQNATMTIQTLSTVPELVLYAENSDGTQFVRTDNNGNLLATGALFAAAKPFKIDHPLDPTNKYLLHTAIESPDMKTMYDGVVILDGNGEAQVELPGYFEALNQDFRYQLTALGAPGPNLYIAEKISGNQFRIAGGKPGAEVSWQVTGIRHDAWANAHRIPVEVDKQGAERGRYLHPDVFGAPPEMSVSYNGGTKRRQLPEFGRKRPKDPLARKQ